jgi:NADH:ubiquinone oxidoreductase subunit F (NADH-binding)
VTGAAPMPATATDLAIVAGPADAALPRLFAGPAAGPDPQSALADHVRVHGPVPPHLDPARVLGEITASGLAGRGGARFPTGRKLAAVRSASGGPAVIVGNGAEGEPASRKDAAILWHAPHLVLDGLQVAAAACGAGSVTLAIHGGRSGLRWHLDAAIAARQAAGLDRLPVVVRETPARFLAGEETALTGFLDGGSAVPAFKQYRVFERGVGGRPTLVQNVETLAHLALIARHGAGWFRAAGTQTEPGTLLCTATQADGSTRVVETQAGVPIGELVRLGDGVQAVLAGGYHGGWLTAADARALRFSDTDLRPAGAFTGAGVLAALPASACGLAETASVARYLALESAGQCGPCLNGLPRIAAALTALARPGPAPADLANVQRWAGLIGGRGACHHPDGTVRFVATALRVFAAEIAVHAQGRCRADRQAPTAFLPVPAPPLTESDWR